MQITSIEMESVFSHVSTSVVLPVKGLVLVTGRNGSGKTTLIEAVALAVWGMTFRKRNPGWSGDVGRVLVRTRDHTIERVKSKSKVTTTFDDVTSFTRVKDALDHATQTFGAFDIWRRVHVFASRDVARFTTATDAFRKRMLEELLGLDRFETASAACREDKRKLSRAHQDAERLLSVAVSAEATTQARLSDAEHVLSEETPEDAEELEAKLSTITGKLKRLDDAVRAINKSRQEADRAVWEAEQGLKHAEEHQSALQDNLCSTCGQKITAGLKRAANAGVAKARVAAVNRKEAAEAHREQTSDQYDKLQVKKRTLTDKHVDLHSRVKSAKDALRRQSDREERRKKIAETVIDCADEVASCSETLEQTHSELRVIEVVDRVLSTQGVRAHLLTNALTAIESVSNNWLARVAMIDDIELSLHLSSYSEKGDGSLRDAIGLDIDGAGNGHGYEAASSGEQRRIDVALMLALAEMAEAAHGVDSGTLFFDEVFDALDEDGVEAVRDVIASLAKDRCVLLITHNDQMQTRLKGLLTEHWHVDQGEIYR